MHTPAATGGTDIAMTSYFTAVLNKHQLLKKVKLNYRFRCKSHLSGLFKHLAFILGLACLLLSSEVSIVELLWDVEAADVNLGFGTNDVSLIHTTEGAAIHDVWAWKEALQVAKQNVNIQTKCNCMVVIVLAFNMKRCSCWCEFVGVSTMIYPAGSLAKVGEAHLSMNSIECDVSFPPAVTVSESPIDFGFSLGHSEVWSSWTMGVELTSYQWQEEDPMATAWGKQLAVELKKKKTIRWRSDRFQEFTHM